MSLGTRRAGESVGDQQKECIEGRCSTCVEYMSVPVRVPRCIAFALGFSSPARDDGECRVVEGVP